MGHRRRLCPHIRCAIGNADKETYKAAGCAWEGAGAGQYVALTVNHSCAGTADPRDRNRRGRKFGGLGGRKRGTRYSCTSRRGRPWKRDLASMTVPIMPERITTRYAAMIAETFVVVTNILLM